MRNIFQGRGAPNGPTHSLERADAVADQPESLRARRAIVAASRSSAKVLRPAAAEVAESSPPGREETVTGTFSPVEQEG